MEFVENPTGYQSAQLRSFRQSNASYDLCSHAEEHEASRLENSMRDWNCQQVTMAPIMPMPTRCHTPTYFKLTPCLQHLLQHV